MTDICKATTRRGSPCTRRAVAGESYCRIHLKGQEGSAVVVPEPESESESESDFEFESIIKRCSEEVESAQAEGVRVQWCRLLLDCVKASKEEQRLLSSNGVRPIEVYIVHKLPDGPRPVP